ncbi:ribosomal protein S6--L-glutamate ligase [Streptomyces sp. Ag109_G2-6]|uniref:ATP-grasp domain-containing protein n=1 Tax=Streptomyces TaxID=1883 RepID=UPI0009A4AADE|nr:MULTISPECIES: alpha-L-glutamate ligase [Streptomyces]RPF29519.1 ribosomal protein S6--L-glutamate ligase [Streptomyces sp. Ag109_G2-6]
MRIGLITPDPGHPLLAATAALLGGRHEVEVLHPGAGAAAAPAATADVYLLKARTPAALELARALEDAGAPVLNSAAATERCQDRTGMAELARGAGLPFAATRTFASLSLLGSAADLGWPLVAKSRRSRKDDLVVRLDGPGALRELEPRWGGEPVITQAFAPNDGWDHKLWVVGDEVFAGLRRSELAVRGEEPARSPDRLPDGWAALALRVGEVFGLDVYGVDVIATGDGPLIVDVNAFPGIRGQAGAPEALAALALSRAATAARQT